MKVIILIIVLILVFYNYRRVMRKIDKEEEERLRTPGRADFLRDKHSELVAGLLSMQNYEIRFERKDMIHLVNDKGRIIKHIICSQHYPGIWIQLAIDNAPLKEWRFDTNQYNDVEMLKEIEQYLTSFSVRE